MINWLTQKITRAKINAFISNNASDGLTLDLGCSLSFYEKYFPNRIGVDVVQVDGVDLIADAHNLPFTDNKFDNILCTEVLEHLHSPCRAISEMQRVLKPGGKLILTTRFIFPLHDTPNDYYRFTKYGLKKLFENWEIVGLISESDTIETFAVLFQRICYQTKLRGGKMTKVIIFLLAKILGHMKFFVKEEYGTIQKSVRENNILSSGYYLVCKNSKR